MTTQRDRTTELRPLEILGISEAEERAYESLLARSGATAPEIAQALALTPGKTQRLLDALEGKGLTTHTPERPRRYIPASPDVALKALMLRHQEHLQRAEGAMRKLQERNALRRRGEQEQMVELITTREAESQVFAQMHEMVQNEIVTLIRPPMRVSPLDVPIEQDHHPQREAQARGVRYRSIVDAEFLTLPGAIGGILADMKAGEEVRVFPHLPFKLILADGHIALIPLNLQQPDSPSLLVRSSALLDALYALFKILWERATPLSLTRGGALETGDRDSRLPQEVEELIPLMAAGLNDKKIADELHISIRTLRRRVVEMMKTLNTRTRFQAGWRAALQLSDQNAN